MPVDFFSAACKSESSVAEFGICDDPPPPNTPAYVDEDTSNKQNMRPCAAENHKIEMERCKNDTGLILWIEQEISIP